MSEILPPGADADERLDAVLAEYLEAQRQGYAPPREELLARHPDLADALADFFEDQDLFAQAARPLDPIAPRSRRAAPGDETVTYPGPGGSGVSPDGGPPAGNLTAAAPALGKTFAHYDQLEEIARGGMGIVYRARERTVNRVVALKMIRAGHLASAAEVARFRKEAEAAARLQHPHIVPIYEVGEHQGHPYYTMKFIAGGSLAEHLPRYHGKPREAARLLATVARAVHFAHQRQILHRDLKPANILLEGDRDTPLDALVPHITDLGLAKQLDPTGFDPALPPTQTGDIVGTPCYMAPEQARGEKNLTTAVDVYSLGAILYEMLTGRPPFREENTLDTLMRVMNDEPAPPRQVQRRVPRDLETIALKCLRKEPAARYPSADALAEDLERWLTGRPIQARRTRWPERLAKWVRRQPVVASLLLLVLLVLGAGVAGIVWKWQDEVQARRDAVQAREELARTLYFQTIALAERELSANRVGRAEELLTGPNCPPGLRGWEWEYLNQKTHPYAPTLHGHAGAVFAVAVSPDGQRIVSAGGTHDTPEVKVWDAITGRERASFGHREGQHRGWIRGLAFHPDGRWLATAASDGTVLLWDTTTWQVDRRLVGHTVRCWCVCFNKDGSLLASGGGGESPDDDGEIIVWETATGRQRHLILRPRDRIWKLAFHPEDLTELASAGEDRYVRVWDVGEGAGAREVIPSFARHKASAVSVAYSPDGRLIAAGSGTHHTGDPAEVRVWERATGREVFVLSGHTDEIWGLTFSPDGRRLASASHDQTVKLWDVGSGREALTLVGHSDNVRGLAFTPQDGRLVSVSEDHTVKVWEPRPVLGGNLHPPSLDLQGHEDRVWCVAYSPDGKRLASAGEDRTVRLWVREGGGKPHLERTLGRFEGAIRDLAFDPSGRLLATASYDNKVRLWDVGTENHRTLPGDGMGYVHGVAFSPDGAVVAAVSKYSVRLWDLKTGQPIVRKMPQHAWVVSALEFRRGVGGMQLATASWDQTVQLWDVREGRPLRPLRGHTGRVQCLAFRPDGKRLATAGNAGVIRLWDPDTGEEVGTLKGHSNAVVGLAYVAAPGGDGWLLASSGRDETVRVWDSEAGAELLTLRGHVGQVHGIAFRPDGKELAVSSGDGGRGTVRLWALPELQRPRNGG